MMLISFSTVVSIIVADISPVQQSIFQKSTLFDGSNSLLTFLKFESFASQLVKILNENSTEINANFC